MPPLVKKRLENDTQTRQCRLAFPRNNVTRVDSFVRRGGCFEDGDGSGRAACLGNGRGCYVADPASAVKMAFNVGPRFNFPILASKSLSDKTVLCVALPALCTILNPQPQITMSRQATVQLDNAPATGGLVDSGSTVAANVRRFNLHSLRRRYQLVPARERCG